MKKQPITEVNIADILQHLQYLHTTISHKRRDYAPLEAQLQNVYETYHMYLGPLLREHVSLEEKIERLQARIEHFKSKIDKKQKRDLFEDSEAENHTFSNATQTLEKSVKDLLMDHLVMLVDDENDEDNDFIAHMQGLCDTPHIRLADVLEKIAWGPLWVQRNRSETIIEQYQRLYDWQKALEIQLHQLLLKEKKIHRDRRYMIWLQYQKGAEQWSSFLIHEKKQLVQQNSLLRQKLSALQERYKQQSE